MSNLEIIEELCSICSIQNKIIEAQSAALEQVGATLMENEKAEAYARFNALVQDDESPNIL